MSEEEFYTIAAIPRDPTDILDIIRCHIIALTSASGQVQRHLVPENIIRTLDDILPGFLEACLKKSAYESIEKMVEEACKNLGSKNVIKKISTNKIIYPSPTIPPSIPVGIKILQRPRMNVYQITNESAAPFEPERKQHVLEPFREPSTALLQHYSQPKTSRRALPSATPNIAELLGRAGQHGFRGRKFLDIFDKIRKPQYENIFDSIVRQQWINGDQALNVKEKYRPEVSEDEIRLFSLPINDMYCKLDEMINDASYYHKSHDEDANCQMIENQFHTYFVSFYAVVVHFARYFKVKETDNLANFSVPLLLGVAMDRNQTQSIRRQALMEMTLKAIDLTKRFTKAQCLKLPYPMNVLCLSYQSNPYFPENAYHFLSPNISECTESDDSTKKIGGGGQSIAADEDCCGGGKKSSSSSTKTSISEEVIVAAVE